MDHIYTAIAVFAITTICSLTLLSSRLELWKKILVVLSLCVAGTLSYRLMNQVYGMPALLNKTFDKVWVHGYHADPDNGWIYIWLREEDGVVPINYKTPYSERLHKKLDGNSKEAGGEPYMGSMDVGMYPLERFEESADDLDIDVLPSLPPKNN